MNQKLSVTEYQNIFHKLGNWIKQNDYKSFDVCDISSTKLYLTLIDIHKRNKYGKYLYFPFEQINKKAPSTLRKIANSKKKEYAQAYAVISRAYSNAYKKNKDKGYLDNATQAIEKLLPLRSEGFENYCWGQPYDWYSRKLIPFNTPRATVTSQVGSALLDIYEINNDERLLNIANSTGNFFIEDMEIYKDTDGHICFPYTAIDNYKIHNASMLAAAFLYRLSILTSNKNFLDYSINASEFTIKHQREDGAWHYMAPPHKTLGKIDNYHTGFVLEAFLDIKKADPDNFPYDEELKKGMNFYLQNFFIDETIPKMTPKKTYPLDIQSCAQSIITLEEAKIVMDLNTNIPKKTTQWTIENFWDDNNDYFYYRKYKSGKIDESAYIRWSESWMLRALSYMI